MKARKGQLTGVDELIDNIGLPSKVKTHLKSHKVWSHWQQIVGPELFRVTAPLEIKSHTLVIKVAHQAWAQQLHFLRPSILGKIKTHAGESSIRDLQFRVGDIEPHEYPTVKENNFDKKKELKQIKLSERQEMTLRAVEDPELRDRIRSAMQAEAARFQNQK